MTFNKHRGTSCSSVALSVALQYWRRFNIFVYFSAGFLGIRLFFPIQPKVEKNFFLSAPAKTIALLGEATKYGSRIFLNPAQQVNITETSASLERYKVPIYWRYQNAVAFAL
jgi:hypothetical protein